MQEITFEIPRFRTHDNFTYRKYNGFVMPLGISKKWYCYDKNGDAYENAFCSSNGKEYFVGEDGQLVRSEWVEYDGNYYFVNSSDVKIANDWSLTTPYDDDSADEYWYYLKKVTGKPTTGN